MIFTSRLLRLLGILLGILFIVYPVVMLVVNTIDGDIYMAIVSLLTIVVIAADFYFIYSNVSNKSNMNDMVTDEEIEDIVNDISLSHNISKEMIYTMLCFVENDELIDALKSKDSFKKCITELINEKVESK